LVALALIVAALLAIAAVLALTAHAANSIAFSDALGDNQVLAPDISQLELANDDNGLLTFAVDLANRPALQDSDIVLVLLDTDGNLATGCGFGAEYRLAAVGLPGADAFLAQRCDAGQWVAWSPPSFGGAFDAASPSVRFALNQADLGGPAQLGVFALTIDPSGTAEDFAPETPTGDPAVAPYDIVIASAQPTPPNALTFTDPAGDEPLGFADIDKVVVGADGSGVLTFQIRLPNRTALEDDDLIVIYLNTDLDTTTGCAPYGADYELIAAGFPGKDIFIGARCFAGLPSTFDPPSLDASFFAGTHTLTVRVNRADVGNPRRVLFRVHTLRLSTSGVSERAPGSGPAGYNLPVPPPAPTTTNTTVATTTTQLTTTTQQTVAVPPPPPPDLVRPRVAALGVPGARAGAVRLAYRVFDDTGTTRETIAVYGPLQVHARQYHRVRLGRRRLDFAPTSIDDVLHVSWPARIRGLPVRTFCVQAFDEAGNASSLSCAGVGRS